jgi:hypothetical protein
MTIITKGMGAVIKAAMKKAGVKKPTFPGPRSIEILNKRLKKKQKFKTGKFSGLDLVESSSKTHKSGKQGASFIELNARITKGKR